MVAGAGKSVAEEAALGCRGELFAFVGDQPVGDVAGGELGSGDD